MSLVTERSVTCPGCGKTSVHRVARSLNAQRSPELVQAILAGRFQRFPCPTCNDAYVVEDPFVYIDFDARLWIGHYPREREAEWQKLEFHAQQSFQHAMNDHAPELVRSMSQGFTVRTVFGLGALRDKLLCFQAGLDDRMLEVLKLDLLRGTRDLPFTRAARPELVRLTQDELVLYAPLPPPGMLMHVRKERLGELAAQAPAWDPVLHELSKGPYVDIGRILPA